MKRLFIPVFIIAIAVIACKTTEPAKTSTVPVKIALDCSASSTASFAKDIKPIFDQYCVSCHGDAGGYDFTTFADISRAAKNGDLLGTIKWQHRFPKMPANSAQLDQDIINKIECWINNGLKP